MDKMNQEPEKEPQKKNKSNNLIMKTATIGALAGILGGGASYFGVSKLNEMTAAPQVSTVSSSNSKTATTNTSSKTASAGEMTSAFNAVKGAVVSVINLQKQSQNSKNGLDYFFGNDNQDQDSQSQSSSSESALEAASEGSGVIYLNSDGKGYIVTNNHVIDGSDQVQVILSDGKTVDATIVGSDSVTDLAVLTIDSKYVTQVAEFGKSSEAQPAEPVIAVGSPLGSEYATSVTQGIISASDRTLNVTNEAGQSVSQTTVIQTDAAINPGNSGGPLVNKAGQIIGINSMKLSSSTDGTAVEGMGFAIPSDEVVNVANQLVKNGKIVRPQLGIRVASVSELTDIVREQLDLPDSVKSGVYVASVTDGGAASAAGIKKGDVITSVDGKEVTDVVSLHSVLYEHKVGDQVKIKFTRDGKDQTVSVTLK